MIGTWCSLLEPQKGDAPAMIQHDILPFDPLEVEKDGDMS